MGEFKTPLSFNIGGIFLLPMNFCLRNRYVIKQHISGTNMSNVYIAFDNDRREEVVVKECSGDDLENKEMIEREARFLSELDHSKIVCIKDYFICSDSQFRQKFYIVMEKIEGKTLEQQKGQLRIREIIHISIKLCKVINYLHVTSKPTIIHRDIKPRNIMVLEDGSIRLIDFGTARFYRSNKRDTFAVLTEGFAAPEQYYGESTVRSDIFGIGATMYYMLTGRKVDYVQPGRGFKKSVTPPQYINRKVSQGLNNVIMKAIAFDQKNRYQSVNDLKKDLEALIFKPAVSKDTNTDKPVLTDKNEDKSNKGIKKSSSNKLMLVLIGVFVIIILLGIFMIGGQ